MKKLAFALSLTTLIIFTSCEDKSNNQSSNQVKPQSTPVAKFDLKKLQELEDIDGTLVSLEDNTLKIVIQPVFDTSKKPSAPNIAKAIYDVAKNLCPTDYPDFGKVALTIAWRESKNDLPHLIVQMSGVKADFCVGYDKAKEKSSDFLAGYTIMNNLFSFPEKAVLNRDDFNLLCSSDMIAKFCREF